MGGPVVDLHGAASLVPRVPTHDRGTGRTPVPTRPGVHADRGTPAQVTRDTTETVVRHDVLSVRSRGRCGGQHVRAPQASASTHPATTWPPPDQKRAGVGSPQKPHGAGSAASVNRRISVKHRPPVVRLSSRWVFRLWEPDRRSGVVVSWGWSGTTHRGAAASCARRPGHSSVGWSDSTGISRVVSPSRSPPGDVRVGRTCDRTRP